MTSDLRAVTFGSLLRYNTKKRRRKMTMHEADWTILGAIGAVASIVGLVTFLRQKVIREVTRDAEHAHLITMVSECKEILEMLEDVLQHPDDTSFSYTPLIKRMDKLELLLSNEIRHVTDND